MVVESHGGSWGLEARQVFSKISQHKAAASYDDPGTLSDQLAQRLSCLLHRENARAVLRRLEGFTSRLSPEVLGAAALASAAPLPQ